jgi:hypothetical protein
MDSLFSFLAKFIGATARVGATVALGALVIYALRQAGIGPFAALDGPTYQIIMSAGVIGFCGVVVDLLIAFGNGVRWAWAKLQQRYDAWAVRKLQKREAIKNLEVVQPDFSATLRFLKANNLKRFPAPANNDLLYLMNQSFLLQIDDSNWTAYSVNTYYKVPDCVWDRIDSNLPVPESPPWVDRV